MKPNRWESIGSVGLPKGQDGHSFSGSLDEDPIIIRQVADGTIANASTLNDFNTKPDGKINIRGANNLIFDIAFVKGSLTNATLELRFGMVRNDTFKSLALPSLTAGAGSLGMVDADKLSILAWTADFSGYVCLPNPGLNWMSVYTSSTGTITSSSLLLRLVRSASSPVVYFS